MKLSAELIKAAAWGAASVCEENGGVGFHRFTEEEERVYRELHSQHEVKLRASSGIRLVFRTDSPTLKLKVDFSEGSSRAYYSLDVAVNGAYIGSIDNFSGVEMIPDYTKVELPMGRREAEFPLGEGEKTVMLCLPWSARTLIEEISLADGSFAEPVHREKKLLAYGDSITQGYDALRSCKRYAALLADSLQAEESNKAIGGEVFFPELAAADAGIDPDYISVAYGTNDWGAVTKEEFERNSVEFYRILSEKYPNAKIFAITPIWRKDTEAYEDRRPIETVPAWIRKAVEPLPNVTLIDGWSFVPADESYYADLRLHPNDEGFAEYHKNLFSAIKPYL